MARAGEVPTAASCSWKLPVPLLYTDTAWLQADVQWFSGPLQAYLGMWLSNVLFWGAFSLTDPSKNVFASTGAS